MRLQKFLTGLALVVATATITSVVVSGPNDQKPAGNATGRPAAGNTGAQPGGMPEMSPAMKEMMAKCGDSGMPNENHKVLAPKVGKWTGVTKMWMVPGEPASESTCTSTVKSIFDGRFLSTSVEGDMPGMGTFLGQSWEGYDNVTKKYFWVWIDNMGTGKMDAVGTYDPGTKTFKYTTEFNCPLQGKAVGGRTIEKWIDKDHFTMEMWGPWYKDQKEYKMMEITYTRAK